MNIKICGLTSLDDALAAIDAGADALGFNFYPDSPRYILPAVCANIQSGLRNRHAVVLTVGVFVNAPPAFVAEVLDTCDLDLAQLSGDEPPEVMARLIGRAYKAIRPRTLDEAEHAADEYAPLATNRPALLVDAAQVGMYGGTGQRADWSIARRLSAAHSVLLAGGLRPDNVAEAIRQVDPWGVDVASGVESSPGKKDTHKMVEFVRAARSARVE